MNQQYIKFEDCLQQLDRRGSVEVEALVTTIGITLTTHARVSVSANIAYDDARKLVEMLIKHTHPGQKLSLPKPVTAPKAHLIVGYTDKGGGRRFLKVSSLESALVNALALKQAEPNGPVWLGYLTKEFVQPTPSYEWKDL